jgi:hypothetical protein
MFSVIALGLVIIVEAILAWPLREKRRKPPT